MAKIVSQGHKTWKNGAVMNYRITDEGVIYIYGSLCDGVIDIKSKSPFHHMVIEAGTTSVGAENFCGLTCLKEITLPPSVISIGNKAFSSCGNLKRINFSEGLETIGAEAFLRCEAIREIALPRTLRKIGDGTFEFCINLSKVTLPPDIDSISNSLFCHCESLETIKIPSGVIRIGESAFRSCESLETVNFPKALKFIDSWAFVGCDRLLNIVLPDREIGLGECAFSYETKFSFTVPDGIKYCCSILNIKIDRRKVFICPDDPKDITGELVFPSSVEYNGKTYSVTAVGGCAGAYKLESVVCPDTVEEIKYKAFLGCCNLKSVKLGMSLRRIGAYAFNGCYALKEADLGVSLREIGEYAFSHCDHLWSLNLPDTLITVRENAFEECGCLRVKLPDSVEKISSNSFKGSHVTSYSHGVIYLGHVLMNYDGYLPKHSCVEVRSGTTVIAEGAFREQRNLEEVIMPAGVKVIGNGAFSRCSGLRRVKLPTSLVRIGQWAFSGTPELKEIVVPWRKPISLEEYAIDEKKTVYIPKGTMEAYSQADNWEKCKLVEM